MGATASVFMYDAGSGMRLNSWSLLLFVAFYSVTAPVCGQDLVVYTEEYPPYNFTKEDGTVGGLATENVRQVLDASGLSYDIRLVPWSRAVFNANSEPNALIYTLTRTPVREGDYHWLVPLADSNFYLFVRADEIREVTFEALNAGKFTGACVVNDLSCSLLLIAGMPEKNIIRVPDNVTGDFRMVMAGRADIYISDIDVNRRFRLEHGIDISVTRPAMRFRGDAGFYLASGPRLPEIIRARIRAAYEKLSSDGAYQLVDAATAR